MFFVESRARFDVSGDARLYIWAVVKTPEERENTVFEKTDHMFGYCNWDKKIKFVKKRSHLQVEFDGHEILLGPKDLPKSVTAVVCEQRAFLFKLKD